MAGYRCNQCNSAPHHCECNRIHVEKCIHGVPKGEGACSSCNFGGRFYTPSSNNSTPPPNKSKCYQCNAQTDLSGGWKETINNQPVCYSCKQRERERERENKILPVQKHRDWKRGEKNDYS